MKKKIGIMVIAVMGLSAVHMTQGISVEAATKKSLIESKQALRNQKIQIKLEMIRQKAGEEVKNKVAEKIEEKETKIAEQKAAQVAAEQAAAQVVVDQTDWGNGVDTTSGASQSGREIGQTNREYGLQLSDPNLSQEQRQAIIQEKKNYNRGRR